MLKQVVHIVTIVFKELVCNPSMDWSQDSSADVVTRL
jgi:hypothetical protein